MRDEPFDSEPPAVQPPSRPEPPPPLPLDYTNRQPPRPTDTAVLDFAHAVAGAVVYLSLLVGMKVASVRFGWDIGAVCGVWVLLLVCTIAFTGWLAGAFGWRGFFIGAVIAMLGSLYLSALVLREGY